MSGAILKNICSKDILQIIVKESVVESIFSKILCFEHILLNTFRWMRLKIALSGGSYFRR